MTDSQSQVGIILLSHLNTWSPPGAWVLCIWCWTGRLWGGRWESWPGPSPGIHCQRTGGHGELWWPVGIEMNFRIVPKQEGVIIKILHFWNWITHINIKLLVRITTVLFKGLLLLVLQYFYHSIWKKQKIWMNINRLKSITDGPVYLK